MAIIIVICLKEYLSRTYWGDTFLLISKLEKIFMFISHTIQYTYVHIFLSINTSGLETPFPFGVELF